VPEGVPEEVVSAWRRARFHGVRRDTTGEEPQPSGADPLLEAAAGQLKETCDPYRLVLPAEKETLAEYYVDELRPLLDGSGRSSST